MSCRFAPKLEASDNNNHLVNDNNNKLQDNNEDSEHPRNLIPELCRHFYNLGWASGTGGGLSIKQDGFIYCAPSGVQKERIQPDDMFILNAAGKIVEAPKNPKLKVSECLSLFMVAFNFRDAGCCIHSHSINANLVTAYHSKANNMYHAHDSTHPFTTEFRITNQEMIKGIKLGSTDQNLNYNDTLVVPIIDNVLYERDLAGAMQDIVLKYPNSNAVLVRNHGVYVWGKTWHHAKSMAECYDYLFKLELEAVRCGFSWLLDTSYGPLSNGNTRTDEDKTTSN